MASWGIALVEYWLAVPANRIGYGTYTGAELKAIQECVSIAIFVGFSVLVLGEKITINTGIGFAPDRRRRLLHLQPRSNGPQRPQQAASRLFSESIMCWMMAS